MLFSPGQSGLRNTALCHPGPNRVEPVSANARLWGFPVNLGPGTSVVPPHGMEAMLEFLECFLWSLGACGGASLEGMGFSCHLSPGEEAFSSRPSRQDRTPTGNGTVRFLFSQY